MRMSDWSSDVCSSDLYPFIVVLNTSANLVLMSIRLRVADDGEDAHSADELKKLLFASHRHGELGDVSVQALSHTLELPELSAGDLMRPAFDLVRSEARRVGKACVSTCRSRWSQYPSKKKLKTVHTQ